MQSLIPSFSRNPPGKKQKGSLLDYPLVGQASLSSAIELPPFLGLVSGPRSESVPCFVCAVLVTGSVWARSNGPRKTDATNPRRKENRGVWVSQSGQCGFNYCIAQQSSLKRKLVMQRLLGSKRHFVSLVRDSLT